jgi:DNA-binding CsgD family transcriptional regulator
MNLITFWEYISTKDISGDVDKLERLEARILNQYSFLLSSLFFFNGIRDLIFGIPANFYAFFSIGVVFLYLFFFTKARFKNWVVLTTVLVCCGFIFVYSSSNGFDNGLSWYYLGVLIATKFLFNERKKLIYTIIIYSVVFILFYIENLYDFKIFNFLSEINIVAPVRDLRMHTFTQVFFFNIFNSYFLFKRNKMIEKLYEQNARREEIILTMHEKLNNNAKPRLVEDVVKLATADDIAFLPMFKQIFPYFQDNLVKVKPDLTSDEFKFCALLKLGFTTKDIAAYNHLTVRSVQTRKNRLRRSFQISSQEDLYAWVDGF